MGADLVPPDSTEGLSEKEIQPWRTEFAVVGALKKLGHKVLKLGISDDLEVISRAAKKWKPDIAFNLMEDFDGEALLDQNVVSLLELLKLSYTGCGPRGLILARDKALSKKLLSYHQILVPRFAEYPKGHSISPPENLSYPLFVKSLTEEASLGISQASLVRTASDLVDRVSFIHDTVGSDAIAEEFIEGRELYVGLLGNSTITTFPVWELSVTHKPKSAPLIATAKVKWDLAYQKKWGVTSQPAEGLGAVLKGLIQKTCEQCYEILQLTGCARIDIRLDADDKIYILEANPNPDLAWGEDFAEAAELEGLNYENLIQKLLDLGLAR